MTHTAPPRILVCAVALLALGGCQTLDKIDTAADALTEMGESTASLAATSDEALQEVTKTVAVLDQHITGIGEEVRIGMPRVVEATTTLLETIEAGARETGQATATMVERTGEAIETITPEVRATLVTMRETVESTGKSLETISQRMDGTMKALERLTNSLEQSSAAGSEMLQTTQAKLNASLLEAQKTLAQTSTSLVRIEQESVTTMRSLQESMSKLAGTFSFMAQDDDDEVIQRLGNRVDSLVTLFLWVQILGALTIISVTVLFIHRKVTTRGRHEALARKIGLDPK